MIQDSIEDYFIRLMMKFVIIDHIEGKEEIKIKKIPEPDSLNSFFFTTYINEFL